MKKSRSGLLWAFALCAALTWAGIDEVMDNQERQLLTDKLETMRAEMQADVGTLELVFEDQYDRNFIEFTSVTVSAYSSTHDQTDDTPWLTASGKNAMVGQIAVSRDLINKGLKFGSIVYLKGLGVFRVTDVMAPRWSRKVDIWCMDRTACKLFGTRRDVTMLWMKREE